MSAQLRRSKDRKVTNSVTSKPAARGANSFGLPSGKAFSCPGATGFCEKICYAGKLERLRPAVSDLLMHNWNLLKGASVDEMYSLLSEMMREFVSETDRQVSKGMVSTYDFRIHWDGDFFSRDYARVWAQVISEFNGVRFWVYTRSFDLVNEFVGLDNLSLYLSADPENVSEANEVAARFDFVNIATVADTFEQARATIVDSSRKAYNCPELTKRIPMIDAKGSACLRCGVCPSGRGDVLFSVTKK